MENKTRQFEGNPLQNNKEKNEDFNIIEPKMKGQKIKDSSSSSISSYADEQDSSKDIKEIVIEDVEAKIPIIPNNVIPPKD